METFVEHYNNEEIQLNEFTWEQLGKGFLRVGKNIFGKRVVGVNVDMLTSLKNVDRSTYNFVQGALTTSFKNKNKKGKDIFIKDVYKGEIDDNAKKLGGYENIKGDVQDISVYVTNKGGRIITFYLEEDGGEEFYIGANWGGDKQFKDIFGMWISSLTSRLNYMTKKKNKPKKDLEDAFEDPASFFLGIDSSEYNKSDEVPIDKGDGDVDTDQIGIMDISKDEYDRLLKIWGTGRRGGLVKGTTYPFRGKFVRTIYLSPRTGYNGYKYTDGTGHIVYLIDTGDEENAFVAFQGRKSYDWAKQLDMLSQWRSETGHHPEIRWQSGTIKDL